MPAPGVGKKKKTRKQKLANQAQQALINKLIKEAKKSLKK
jgi:hypothetical protein